MTAFMDFSTFPVFFIYLYYAKRADTQKYNKNTTELKIMAHKIQEHKTLTRT